MHKNIPTPTDDEQTPPIPPPIQGNSQQDGAFNAQKKSEAKTTETGSTTEQSRQNMDADSAHAVENGSKGKLVGVSQNSNGGQPNRNFNSDPISEDQWKAKLNSAKQHWNKLEQEELLSTQGDSEQLSSLIQKRYSTSKADADMQVKEFFNK